MSAAGLSFKTIVNNVAVVKMVVASVVNKDGVSAHLEHTFIGLPIVDRSAQERQTVSQVQLQTILANAPERYSILLALIAGTGLHVGEAAGLHHSDFQNECGVLYVQGSVWHVKPQLPRPRMPCSSSIHHIARIFPISKFAAAHRLCPMRALFSLSFPKQIAQEDLFSRKDIRRKASDTKVRRLLQSEADLENRSRVQQARA